MTMSKTAFLLGLSSLLRLTLLSPFLRSYSPWMMKSFIDGGAPFFRHPAYSIDNLREQRFISRFFDDDQPSSFSSSYRFFANDAYGLPPLVSALFHPVLSLGGDEDDGDGEWWMCFVFGVLSSLVDAAISKCLFDICRRALDDDNDESIEEERMTNDTILFPPYSRTFGLSSTAKNGGDDDDAIISLPDLPTTISLCYYCNPLVIASSSAYLSFQNVSFLLFLLPLRSAGRGDGVPATLFWVACGVYWDAYLGVTLTIPVVLLLARRRRVGLRRLIPGAAIFFIVWICSLFGLSRQLVGDDVSISYYYKQHEIYQPSLSTLWYFSLQQFDRFRTYFRTLMFVLPYTFVLPLTIRFHRYPIELAVMFILLHYIYNPIQTLAHLSFALTVILFSPRTMSRMVMMSFVALLCLPVPVTLCVLFYWQWIETGAGNPNYLFFQCLGANLFVAGVFVDYVDATLKRDKARRILAKLENR